MNRADIASKIGTVLIIFATTYLTTLTSYLMLRTLFGNEIGPLALVNNFALLTLLPLPAVLMIALTLRRRWLIYWAASLSLLASIWLTPYYWPKPTVSPTGQTIRLVTFNNMGWNRPLTHTVAWLHQQDADIIFLQEIPRRYVEQGAAELKSRYPYQTGQPIELRYSGTGIFSKLPIHSVEYTATYQRAVVELEGKLISVYNVHLTQPTSASDGSMVQKVLTYNDAGHQAQVTALLTEIRQDPHPFIVAGDFNMSDQSPTYPKVAAVMQDSFLEVGSGLGLTWPLRNWEDRNSIPAWMPPLLRMDYVWHSPHFRAIQLDVGPWLDSDHLPLYATLEVVDSS
ncbi:endonuclease/exonuclease/phosphatase family protein [Anaerolineales bacterium HSG24]|nr:endonuclease/exonuclease/phosphatase family protein [Anaerolineales bacterium HSG24]